MSTIAVIKTFRTIFAAVTSGGDLGAIEAIPENLENENDRKVDAEMRTQCEELLLKHERLWQERAEEDRPKATEFIDAIIRLVKASNRAYGKEKRKMLFNATRNVFRPEFYDKGVSSILWAKVEALAYPDVWFLERVLSAIEGREEPTPGQPPLQVSDNRYVTIKNTDENFEYAKNLEKQGLMVLEDFVSKVQGGARSIGGGGIITGNNTVSVMPTGIAKLFRDFALRWYVEKDLAGGPAT